MPIPYLLADVRRPVPLNAFDQELKWPRAFKRPTKKFGN
jgi:hypothetical protein